MASYTGDWQNIGDNDFFRKIELYSMQWSSKMNVDNYFVCGASFGGPIAIFRDEKQFLRVTTSVFKPLISIFTSSGSHISSIKWDSGVLVKIGWTSSEELLCVQDDGTLLSFDMFGNTRNLVKCLKQNSGNGDKVVEAEIYPSNNGTGVCFVTSSGNFLLVNNHKIGKVTKLPSIDGGNAEIKNLKVTSWAVVSSRNFGPTSVVVAKEHQVFTLSSGEQCMSANLNFTSPASNNSPIVSMSVSLDGNNIALLTESGILWLGTSNLKQKYVEYPTGLRSKTKQMVWCGTEAVVISWDTSLMLVNKEGNSLTFVADSSFQLVPEIDSVRLIGTFYHEIIQRVPDVTKYIFGIGSVAPGSVLLEAYKKYLERNHKSDEYIRLINDMEAAVDQTIAGAGYEFDPTTQKVLLKAAKFGKCFLHKYDPQEFVRTCQMLRVLNAVKDYKIGMPLTYTQLDSMGVNVLIDRLIVRRQYALALKIADFLKLSGSAGRAKILAHWALYKVSQTHIDETDLAKEIHMKIKSDPSVSYNEISNKALEAGRKKLALHLAHFEPRTSVQVPLFLKLGDKKTALKRAVDGGDSNLILMVLMDLSKNMPLSGFQMLIRNYPVAQKLYIKYCETFNPEVVRAIYQQEGWSEAEAAMFLKDSYNELRVEGRLSALFSAQEQFKKAKNDFAASLCEEQHRLLKHQQSLQQKFSDERFLDLSLHDTLKKLLSLKEIKLSEKLKSEYKVTDKMYWWIRLMSLGEAGEWEEVERLAKSKRSSTAFGFEEIVRMCLECGNRVEARKYIPKVKEEHQIQYYVLARFYEDAVKTALELKDPQGVEFAISKCYSVDRAEAERLRQNLDQMEKSIGSKK